MLFTPNKPGFNKTLVLFQWKFVIITSKLFGPETSDLSYEQFFGKILIRDFHFQSFFRFVQKLDTSFRKLDPFLIFCVFISTSVAVQYSDFSFGSIVRHVRISVTILCSIHSFFNSNTRHFTGNHLFWLELLSILQSCLKDKHFYCC